MQNLSNNHDLIYQKALSLLSRREHSSHELFLKLKERFPEAVAEIKTVLTELETKKLLVNQRFVHALMRHRAGQGYGPNYIRQELKFHHLKLDEDYLQTPEIIEAFFAGWLKKFKLRFKVAPSNTLAEAQLLKYFLQRGFQREQVFAFLERQKGFN